MQKFTAICLLAIGLQTCAYAQSSTATKVPASPLSANADYQPTPEKVFDLIHTKLNVKFDYQLKRMPAKAWLTLKPHFYASDHVMLDAKGMIIHKVALVKGTQQKPLTYDYADKLHLTITLDKAYKNNEPFILYIEYTACPDEMKFNGSAAITDAKGLYFINPDGKDSTKPIQIWTQGETEATSVWCPTIDRPNQKSTQEFSMTVPAKYVSLSNGLLVKQVINKDSTRTDTWKMDLPNAPYLFFMGVGDFAIIKDKLKNLPVDYYVEKKYASVARAIFGETPAMIDFFGKLLGVQYPWPKYAQMVGQDYVSGAMENTTATLHGAAAYQNARQLKDENKWEIVVAHELFHQWFGDLVTAESWGNLTVNESFADYSEYLWLEKKYGSDHALAYNKEAMDAYITNPNNIGKHLVRFQFDDKEEMFDGVSYQKGGRILNMLRHYLGDSAFFKGLNVYLTQNKFKNAEAHQLRLALEEVSGRDLNWFFDQWYFNNNHPKVKIDYQYNDERKIVQIAIEQLQKDKLYNLPVEVDIYTNGKADALTYWVSQQHDTISISYETKPDWIDIDPSRLMLWEKKNNQTESQWLAQAKFGTNYLHKKEVLDFVTAKWKDTATYNTVLLQLLNDKYFGTRKAALMAMKRTAMNPSPEIIATVEKLSNTETNLPVKALAIDVLSIYTGNKHESFYAKHTTDSSYSVAGAAFESLARTNPVEAIVLAPFLKKDAKGALENALLIADYLQKDTVNAASVVTAYKQQPMLPKLSATNALLYFANKIESPVSFRKTVGAAVEAYFMLRMDYMGMQTTIAATLLWMTKQREARLLLEPNNTNVQQQLKYLKEKTKL